MKASHLFQVTFVSILVASAPIAQAAGLITSVVQNNGDTDRPAAQFTGNTFDIQNPNGTVLVAGYTVPLFGEDARGFTDRVHQYNGISNSLNSVLLGLPSYLVGGEYIMIANNNRDNQTFTLDVTLSQEANVYLLIDNRAGGNDGNAGDPPMIGTSTNQWGLPFMQWVSNQGFTGVTTGLNRQNNPLLPDEVGYDENANVTLENYASVYSKTFGAGTFSLGEFGWGRNMYGVVVTAVPEPASWLLFALGGLGLLLIRWRK